ncbi:Golgi-associated kinase 1A [Trichomycterus rosablanca]|uniref:Golgi-associated kinase 1A n=1 Tax=Trichomycterus rosablanca TaxID=2290929 RepID=UPI002F35B878
MHPGAVCSSEFRSLLQNPGSSCGLKQDACVQLSNFTLHQEPRDPGGIVFVQQSSLCAEAQSFRRNVNLWKLERNEDDDVAKREYARCMKECVHMRNQCKHQTSRSTIMALKAGLKLKVKRCYILALLSLLTFSAVMINTYSPFPSEQTGLPSHGPQQKRPTELLRRLPLNVHSGDRKLSRVKDSTKHTPVGHGYQNRGIKIQKRVHKPTKGNAKGAKGGKKKHSLQTFVVNMKEMLANQPGNGNESKSKHAIQLLPRHDQIMTQSASTGSFQPRIKPCRHKCSPDAPKPERFMGSTGSLRVNLKNTSGTKTHERRSASSPKKKPQSVLENNVVSGEGADLPDFMTRWCQISHDDIFSENWNQTQADSLPWFSRDDVEKIDLLARGTVLTKARLSGHGQVLQVGLGEDSERNHTRLCQEGNCALIKRPGDWIEVLAFHLDRILGLNRSLPAVMRMFNSSLLPYKYTSGSGRPVVWWDPDIQHLADDDNDQNSFLLTWTQYQTLLKARCGIQVPLDSTMCVGVHHSEWGRLALFDFLLQVNDRLDRYCCGFQPDPTEMCVENLLNVKCANSKDLMLVHILVRRTDPSRLVFIDNAGRPRQPHHNLNFRLTESIDEFPERAVSVLRSGCLERLLLRSLSVDKELWRSRGGAAGLRGTVHTIQHRAQILLQRIQDKRLNHDL